MNISMILYFLGWVLKIEGILMILPCAIALIYQELSGLYFLGIGLFCVCLLYTSAPDEDILLACKELGKHLSGL